MKIINDENLAALEILATSGEKYDVIELDGPYNSGLEDWDLMPHDDFIAHYSTRLEIIHQVLDPRGLVFVFGYPEWCAEIKAWAINSGGYILRRWLSWFCRQSAHKGRKIQSILILSKPVDETILKTFRETVKAHRVGLGLTVQESHNVTGIGPGLRGGYTWFESEAGKIPNDHEYKILKKNFNLPDSLDSVPRLASYPGLTDIDLIMVPPEPALVLNDDTWLKSKPVNLYVRLFQPMIQARKIEKPQALILYGGSGNAGIAAEALGFDVTLIEKDPARCQAIRDRAPAEVGKWTLRLSQKSFLARPGNQLGLFGGEK